MASSISNVYGSSSVNYTPPPSTSEKSHSAEAVFSKLSSAVGGDGKTITKNQVENYVAKSNAGNSSNSNSSGPLDKSLAEFSGKLLDNWNSISGGDESITKSDLEAGMTLFELKLQKKDQTPSIAYGSQKSDNSEFEYGHHSSTVITSFDTLAAAVGANGNKITKDQLVSYLESLTSDIANTSANTTQVTFIKNLIAKFDTLSGNGKYITSLDGATDAQDYATVTPEQVTPPIDIKIF